MPRIAASERDAFYASRRSDIAEAALRLWAARGFDSTPVEAIAKEVGISKGALYLYYASKQALLEEVMRRNSLVPVIEELAADLRDSTLEEAVHAFVRAAWSHLRQRRELLLVVLRELPTHLDEARLLLERVLAPANERIESYLEARLGSARGDEISFAIAGRSLLGMVLFVFLTQEVLGLGRILPASDDAIATTISELFLRGVTGGRAQGPQ